MDDTVTQPYAFVVLISLLAVVSFLLGWSRSDQTLVYVGHSATAFASIITVGIGPLWLSIAAGVVFVANLGLLLARVRRA
jgi:hypothetical protein